MAKAGVGSLRLTLAYEGPEVRLVSRQFVETMALQSEEPQGPKPESGFWYELQDTNRRTLYWRIAQNPMQLAAEVRSDDAARPLAWQRKTEARGTFVLLVPRLEQAKYLVLFSSPLDPADASKPSTQLVRLDLSEGKESRR